MPPSLHRRAFTLIEMLVVAAVIGVLASLLFPVLSKAQVKARQTSCASNMRQLGLALLLYADDHEGWLPLTTHGTTNTQRSWIFTVRPYLGNVDAVRVSPSDPHRQARLTNHASSYVLNEYTSVDVVDPFGGAIRETFRNVSRLPNPTGTHTTFLCADEASPSVFSDHTHSRNWVRLGQGRWQAVVVDIAPDRHRTGARAADRTAGAANYLFADGHVTALGARVLKREIDRGHNPARPPE